MYQLFISTLMNKNITPILNKQTVLIASTFIFNLDEWEQWNGLDRIEGYTKLF